MWNSVENIVLFIFIRIKIVIFLSFPSNKLSKKFPCLIACFINLFYILFYLVFGFEKPRFYAGFKIYLPTLHCKLAYITLQTCLHYIANLPTLHCKLAYITLQTCLHYIANLPTLHCKLAYITLQK